MTEIEFNLLDEPWIRVMTRERKIDELSLPEALIESHKYVDFAGELEPQNVAVLRLCLAVLHTVFSRYDVDGKPEKLTSAAMARKRWKKLWKLGHFPETVIRQYLEQYRERFWLFHPDKPFYQVNEAKKGTEYTAAKLNGEISESGNKIRMFAIRSGEAKSQLTYAEAARWLLFINGFDDTSAKPRQKGLPSPGAGWIGRLGIVEAVGHNLFETLMLNLVFERMGDKWNENKPVWEQQPKGAERTEIPMPDNPAELLTLQSRRLLLVRKNELVVGYYLLGGDFFLKTNAFIETMTAWAPIVNKGDVEAFQPKRHDPQKQMWREFGNFFLEDEKKNQRPGVVSWVTELRRKEILDEEDQVTFRSVSVQYGDKDFFIADTFSDSITFHANLLKTDIWVEWGERVRDEVRKCEEMARVVGDLSKRLNLAAGSEQSGDEAKAEFYRQIDLPFRSWLRMLDPEEGQKKESEYAEKVSEKWHKTVTVIAKKVADQLMENAGPAAFIGRKIEGKDKTYWYCCAPKVYNIFLYRMGQVYSNKVDEQK